MHKADTTSEHELFVFAVEDDAPVDTAGSKSRWIVLIVDDEPDVHDTTLLALRGVDIEGRSLSFLHAYSASEAKSIISAYPDIAVLLLDVVMESDSAGLDLVKYVREELKRNEVRIVLRTGQPGYAPELDTIRHYDINDYKTKSELTRIRLFTSLTVAIRSYRQLRQSEATRNGLEKIIAASIDLGRIQNIKRFGDGVVTQLCGMFEVEPEGLVCVANQASSTEPTVIAAAGRYAESIGQPLDSIPNPEIVARLHEALDLRQTVIGKCTCLYFSVNSTDGIAAYLNLPDEIDEIDRRLLRVFSTNITAGFESVFLQQKVFDLAYLDAITGLPNRNAFVEFVQDEADDNSVVAQIDIDNFSEINSVFDIGYGEKVLQAVAVRLAECFLPPVRLARLGPDMFALLGSQDAVSPGAITSVFADPFHVGEHSLRLSATSGFVAFSNESRNGNDVLRKSSIAVKQAKLLAPSKHLYFDPEHSVIAKERLLLLSGLRSAFSSKRLFLMFQPFINLPTNKVVGAEALLRWKTESGGYVPPDRFIHLAEESGLMVPLGEWIMRTAFREQRRFQEANGGAFRMAVNVSHTQFREPDFVEMLARAMTDSDINPQDVEIELTESVAIDDLERIMYTLKQLRRMGVSIAIDDFGTGFSSLSVIRKLPVHRLKIDRSFINCIEDDPSIAKLVIGLARELNLETIAEGIETDAQCKLLQGLGCHDGQGYLFSRPLMTDDLVAFLLESSQS